MTGLSKEKSQVSEGQLVIADYCPRNTANYNWREQAWLPYRGQKLQPITSSKGSNAFEFQEPRLESEFNGLHLLIPQGEASETFFVNPGVFGEPKVWLRAVSGKGLLIGQWGNYPPQSLEISPSLKKNPVVELPGQGLFSCVAGGPDFVVELIKSPKSLMLNSIPGGQDLYFWRPERPGINLVRFWCLVDQLKDEAKRLMREGQLADPKIVEFCPKGKDNYRFKEEAWLDGQLHPIELIETIKMKRSDGGEYTIKTGVFLDEAAREGQIAQWYLNPGTASNVTMIESHDFKLRTRAVSGKGWILVYHPEFGVRQIKVDPKLKKNPIVEIGYGYVSCFIADPNNKQVTVFEGIETPDYKTGYERVVEDYESHTPNIVLPNGYSALFSLYEPGFWDRFDYLLKRRKYGPKKPLRMAGEGR